MSGQIVNYVNENEVISPAIIVSEKTDCVNLQVFEDGNSITYKVNVPQSDGKEANTYHTQGTATPTPKPTEPTPTQTPA